jgi:hypothetical protein
LSDRDDYHRCWRRSHSGYIARSNVLRQTERRPIIRKCESSQKPTTETRIDEHSKVSVLSDIELDAVTGGTKGAVVQAGWNLVQNKKAA